MSIQDTIDASKSVALTSVHKLSLAESAEAFKTWFADRSKHQLTATDGQISILSNLVEAPGVIWSNLEKLSGYYTTFEHDGAVVGIVFSIEGGTPISGDRVSLRMTVGKTIEEIPLTPDWYEDTYYYYIDDTVQTVKNRAIELIDSVTDTIDVITSESEALIDYNMNLLTQVQEMDPDFGPLISAGLNSQYRVVREEAAALAKIPSSGKAFAIIAFIQDWFSKAFNLSKESYDEDPDASVWSLGDYEPYTVGSLVAGAWDVITGAASVLGTILSVVGQGLGMAIGLCVMGVAQIANYFINKVDQNEHMKIGSGIHFEYANGLPIMVGASNRAQASSFRVNERLADQAGTHMYTSNDQYNPRQFSYPCSSLWYPSAMKRFFSGSSYMQSRLRSNRYVTDIPDLDLVPTMAYTRLTNLTNASLQGTSVGYLDTDFTDNVRHATVRVEAFLSSTDQHPYDVAESAFQSYSLVADTGDFMQYLTGDSSSRLKAEELVRITLFANMVSKAWEIAMEVILRATQRYYSNIGAFNTTPQFSPANVEPIWVQFLTTEATPDVRVSRYNIFDATFSGSLGVETFCKVLLSMMVYGDSLPYPDFVGSTFNWDFINKVLDSGLVIDNHFSTNPTKIADMLSNPNSESYFMQLILMCIDLYLNQINTDQTYRVNLLMTMDVRDLFFSVASGGRNRFYFNPNGATGNIQSPNPWKAISDAPALINDPLVIPPKYAAGSAAFAIFSVAIVTATVALTAITVSKAWRKHVVNRVVQKEKKAKQTLDDLEQIDPKTHPEEYKEAFNKYYKAQRKFQRYASRVGYSSNNVGSFGAINTPSTGDLLEKLPDFLNSANAVVADQLYPTVLDSQEQQLSDRELIELIRNLIAGPISPTPSN